MFTLVILARRRLGIHHNRNWITLTEFTRVPVGTLADIIIDAIHTCATILAHVIMTIINVHRAIVTRPTRRTLARVMREMINAFRGIHTRIELCATERNLILTELSTESRRTQARVRFHPIHTGAVILTLVLRTIINVHLTTSARISRGT